MLCKRVWITSNKPPLSWYSEDVLKKYSFDALIRRITKIVWFVTQEDVREFEGPDCYITWFAANQQHGNNNGNHTLSSNSNSNNSNDNNNETIGNTPAHKNTTVFILTEDTPLDNDILDRIANTCKDMLSKRERLALSNVEKTLIKLVNKQKQAFINMRVSTLITFKCVSTTIEWKRVLESMFS